MRLKKLAAMVLAASVCQGLCVPALAVGNADARLKQVTQSVKQTLDIPDSFTEFYGEPEETPLGTFWRLEWSGEGGDLSVSADDGGKVLSLYASDSTVPSISYTGGGRELHFPNLSRTQAQEKAQKFLERVLTQGERAVFSQKNTSSSLSAGTCGFQGEILLNGLPSPLNFSLRVRLSDGTVTSFSRDDVSEYLGKVPAGTSTISQQEAAGKLEKVLDLRLEYVRDGESSKAVLRYLPEPRDEYYVDAASGELVNLTELRKKLSEGNSGGNGVLDAAVPESAAGKDEALFNGAPALTEAELKGVAHLEDLLSRDELDRCAKGWTALGLEGFELSSIQFNVDREDQTVTARLAYGKKGPEGIARRYVTLDAKDGALLSVYGSRPCGEDSKAAVNQTSAQSSAEAFLKELWPEQFSQMELYHASEDSEKQDFRHAFQYAQKINGYFFPENSIYIQVDALDGSILSLSRTFDADITFDAPDGVISKASALTAWAGSFPKELSYIPVPVQLDLMGDEVKPLIDAGFHYFNALKPGYDLTQSDPGYTGVDAKTGQLVEQTVYSSDTLTYSDLNGHPAQAAFTQLAEYRIGWRGGQARPDAALTQKDLLLLLASTSGRLFDPEDADSLYQYAVRQGLVTLEERADSRTVTRLELVRAFLDCFGFAPAAKLSGIYRCDFTDADALPEGALGYAALAQGLGLLSAGGSVPFEPESTVTRAGAVTMLWRYMSR